LSVHELRLLYPLADLLKAARLPRSSFYYQRTALFAVDKHQEVKEHIKTIFACHKGRYGYRRVAKTLERQGVRTSQNTVQRLMGKLGLKSLVKIKKYKSYKGEVGRTAPNIMKRNFTAKRAHQKLVTDVTEFKVEDGKLYLSPVLDLYNGEIIVHEFARRPAYLMVESMVKKVFSKLKPREKPMLHSDQGWQYQMPAYRKMLKDRKIVQSMSRKGNCHDNAAMESFFGILKSEYFHLNKFATYEELKAGLEEYIHYYNHDRIKLKLGGLSPVQYRTQAARQ